MMKLTTSLPRPTRRRLARHVACASGAGVGACPKHEDECAELLDAALSDVLNQMVNSEGMPAELDRLAFRAGLERVNERLRAELGRARVEREKLRAELGAQRTDLDRRLGPKLF